MKKYDLNKYEIKILNSVYNNFYKNLPNSHVDIFLCGGDLNSNTVRKQVRNFFRLAKNLMIFFPERIFVEYFNLNKNLDYLTLETILAENVDFICIVCESPGAFAELGAFSNNEKLRDKIIVLNDEKYKNDPSFINLGPLKCLKKANKNSVKYYNQVTLMKICLNLIKYFYKKLNKTSAHRSIATITGMFYFLSLILYLFKSLDKNILYEYMKYVINIVKDKPANFDFNATYYAAYKILFNENFVKNKNIKEIELTKSGKDFIYKLIHTNPNPVYNDVISDIIWYKFYHYSS